MPSEASDNRLPTPSSTQPKPATGSPIPCPRCDSTNTKFCYFNNYNLSQPRHFCKGCRRYWTQGGALRNVPVGGGTRKSSSSKRHRSASSAPSSSPSSSVATCSSTTSSMTALEPDGSVAVHAAPLKFDGFCSSGFEGDALMLNAETNGLYMSPGGRGFGYGLGLYDSGIGLLGGEARGSHLWPCSSAPSPTNYFCLGNNTASGGVNNTLQFLSDLGISSSTGGGTGSSGDSFSWPGLAISSPWETPSK